MKKSFPSALATSLAIIVLITGACNKKDDKDKAKDESGAKESVEVSCKTLAAKNKKCADELADTIIEEIKDKIPEEMVEKMRAKVKASAASDDFVVQCEKHWDSEDEVDKIMREQFTKCFKIKECKEYAACLKSTM